MIVSQVQDVGEQPGERRCHDCAQSDEQALHGEAFGTLLFGQQVGNEGAKRLHTNVDGGVENP